MAQKITIQLIDDLNGEIGEETVQFGLDKREYEIDLNKENAEQLRNYLGTYIFAGRETTSTKRVRSKTTVVRKWAKGQGLEVKDRGRLSEEIMDQYRQRTTVGGKS